MTDERIERDVHDHDQDEDTSGILTEEESIITVRDG